MFTTRTLLAIQQLSRAGFPGVGAITARRLYQGGAAMPHLLDEEEAARVLWAEYEELRRLPYYAYRLLPLTKEGLARAFDLADEVIAECAAQGIECLGCDEKGTYPPQLHSLPDKPLVLFAKGNTSLLHEKVLALIGGHTPVVGAQTATHAVARQEVTSFGSLISGLGLGTDALAHRAWLDAGGKSIAVFGGGLVPSIPKGTIPLAYEILENGGCWVSEHPLGTPVQGEQVRLSRRLHTGLASFICIVDAPFSGWLDLAKKQGREFQQLYPRDREQAGMAGVDAWLTRRVWWPGKEKGLHLWD